VGAGAGGFHLGGGRGVGGGLKREKSRGPRGGGGRLAGSAGVCLSGKTGCETGARQVPHPLSGELPPAESRADGGAAAGDSASGGHGGGGSGRGVEKKSAGGVAGGQRTSGGAGLGEGFGGADPGA